MSAERAPKRPDDTTWGDTTAEPQDRGALILDTPRPIPPALDRLPPHLREAAIRSWVAREEDYRYLADR